MSALHVAIDLGGTITKVGVVQDGQVTARDTVASRSRGGLRDALAPLADVVDQLIAGRTIDSVGLAMPGIVDRRAGRALSVNGKWTDAPELDLSGWAQARWGVPLVLENDAVAALAGEWSVGAAANCDGAVMMTLGTGIGTAAVVDGHLLRGSHGQAAIGAHFTVVVGGRLCSCGNMGCAEAEASTAVLPDLARADPRFLVSPLAGMAVIDYQSVFAHAAADPLCADLRDRALQVWSALAVSLVHAYDPEVLVIGGGIAAAGADLIEPLRAYIHRHAWTPWGDVEVRVGACGSDAALLGVAALAATDA